jgi:adenine-specific DNA-methyltransferase
MEVDYKSHFLTDHLVTYLGNKRGLLRFIDKEIHAVMKKLGTENPTIFDGFAGTGVVSRLFKHYASKLHVNDIEKYSHTLNHCYLGNTPKSFDLEGRIIHLNAHKLDSREVGFIEENYAPKDSDNIESGERVFYTNRNAKIIDNIRRMIQDEPLEMFSCLTAPLLVKASIHNNTSGVFKGFHKKNGIGHFGGAGENALVRIKGEIALECPIFLDRDCEVVVSKGDTNEIVKWLPPVDIAYYDPPYNQHPYGSNYFMLNIINDYNEPKIQKGVSGIAVDWYKSAYNKRGQAVEKMELLIRDTPAKFILLSYNDEGIIPVKDMETLLKKYGKVGKETQDYNVYRGSRNLNNRDIKVKEIMWVLEKS